MTICALTTKDNPYNYFTQTDEWESYENSTGCRVLNMLGQFVFNSSSLSFEENAKEIERAIDEIIKYDSVGIFKKVVKQ